MAQYQYTALTPAGSKVKGKLAAASGQELLAELEKKKLNCLHFEEVFQNESVRTIYKMKKKEIIFFCRQMKTMLGAGITITRIFDVLREKTDKPKMRELYRSVYESLLKGSSLSAAMVDEGSAFPGLLIQMVASGEASGTLDRVMKRMEVYFNNDMKLGNKVKSAMIYPILLVVVGIAVIIMIFSFVLPKLFTMFEGMELSASTQFLMNMSKFLTTYWAFLLLGVVVLVFIIKVFHSTEHGKLFFDTLKVKTPKVGKLLRVVYTARFSNSLATLYSSGITVINALQISCDILGNSDYTKEFTGIIEQVREGKTLAGAIENTELFDTMFTSLVYVGEESGELDEVLLQASDYYDEEAQVALERLVGMLEPILIIFLAGIVGFIVVSVISTMYGMYGTIE